MSRACVLLAPGFEEIEAITVIDVLRRADVDTKVLGVGATSVQGSHGITVAADETLAEGGDQEWDLVVLPGGMPGAANLRDDEAVQALVRKQNDRGGRLAAICAAPIALSSAGVLEGKKATSYPAFEGQVSCASYLQERVVVDGTVVTSRGPGTALEFALRLVAELKGADSAQQLAQRMLTDAP